ncbi:MAG TPA: protein kinase [Elusimicrobiota bacterium]|nr:protein kinase [Elusimicrobiota bacterium]
MSRFLARLSLLLLCCAALPLLSAAARAEDGKSGNSFSDDRGKPDESDGKFKGGGTDNGKGNDGMNRGNDQFKVQGQNQNQQDGITGSPDAATGNASKSNNSSSNASANAVANASANSAVAATAANGDNGVQASANTGPSATLTSAQTQAAPPAPPPASQPALTPPPLLSEAEVAKLSAEAYAAYKATWEAFKNALAAQQVTDPSSIDGHSVGWGPAGNPELIAEGTATGIVSRIAPAPREPGAPPAPDNSPYDGAGIGAGWQPSQGGDGAATAGGRSSIASFAGIPDASERPAPGSSAVIPDVLRRAGVVHAEQFAAALKSSKTFLAMGDAGRALQEADRAVAVDPRSAEAQDARLNALLALGRRGEAMQGASDAARAVPALESFRNLAWAELNNGRYKDALNDLSPILNGGHASAKDFLMAAFAYEGLGDRGKEIECLRKAAELDEGYRDVLERALRGERVFDPNARDNARLLDGRGGLGRRANPWALAALLVSAAGALAAAGFALWRRYSPEARRARKAQALSEAVLGGAPGAAAAAGSPEGLLAGKYELSRVLGRGEAGQVWEARDRSLDRAVAVRRVAVPEGDADARARCLERAQVLASLRHPNLVDIYEILEHPTGVYMVFELLRGQTLAALLSARGRLPSRDALRVVQGVAAALACAHERGLAHGNLSPANVLVTEQGLVKVMDLGLAGARLTAARALPRPHWPPEGESAGPRGDVFQLGLLLRELLTGLRPPLRAADPAAGAPVELQTLLREMLDPNPLGRPADARRLLERLGAAAQTAAVS